MKAQVKWTGDLTFIGHADGSGKGIIMDAGVAAGGSGIGVRPMEMLLLGAGGCASIDVILILQKARQQVTDCEVDLSAERAEEIPKVFTRIHMHFKVSGKDLGEKHVARAVELSMTKYCSASQMLAASAELTHDFEIIEIP